MLNILIFNIFSINIIILKSESVYFQILLEMYLIILQTFNMLRMGSLVQVID